MSEYQLEAFGSAQNPMGVAGAQGPDRTSFASFYSNVIVPAGAARPASTYSARSSLTGDQISLLGRLAAMGVSAAEMETIVDNMVAGSSDGSGGVVGERVNRGEILAGFLFCERSDYNVIARLKSNPGRSILPLLQASGRERHAVRTYAGTVVTQIILYVW